MKGNVVDNTNDLFTQFLDANRFAECTVDMVLYTRMDVQNANAKVRLRAM